MSIASIAGPASDPAEAGLTPRLATTTGSDTSKLNLIHPAVIDALGALRHARHVYRRAMGARHMGRPGGDTRVEAAETAKVAALLGLVRAVRDANPCAEENEIEAATRHLTR
jgi:hypothetical protein